MLRPGLTIVAAVTLLAAAQSAHAAIASVEDGTIHYDAGAGELNNLFVTRIEGETFRLLDRRAIVTAGSGCTQETPNQVNCTDAPGHPIVANLADLNDRATSRTSKSVEFFGEGDNDRLAGGSGRDVIDGGDGSDTLTGGGGRDFISGGPGSDQLFGGAGNDVLDGGDGTDLLVGGSGDDSENGGAGDDSLREDATPNGADVLAGGDGIDTVDYSLRSAPVAVAVDNLANDGDVRTSERDDVRESIETVMGGAGNDRLIGRDGPADTLIGGTGDDLLNGRRGRDRIDGGPGIDQVWARDLSADTIDCGDGRDVVAADARDGVARDCEHVRRKVSVSLELVGGAYYPTLSFRLGCPPTAFKYCRGRLVIVTTTKVRTRTGRRLLLVAARGFALAPGVSRLVGVRVRAGARDFIRRGGLRVRAQISGFDGAGPARPAALRFRLRRR